MSDASNTKSSNPPTQNIQWGGRFTEATDAFVQVFTASVDFDQKMAEQDINGSIAHATMLAQVGVLSEAEKTTIIDGLEAIRQEIRNGEFQWSVALEDVHMNIEAHLTQRIGTTGKKWGPTEVNQWRSERVRSRSYDDEVLIHLHHIHTTTPRLRDSATPRPRDPTTPRPPLPIDLRAFRRCLSCSLFCRSGGDQAGAVEGRV